MASLRLEDFSDRELLYGFEDHSDEDGTVSSQELAEGLGLRSSPSMRKPAQNIAIRLGWLRRYGVVDRAEETGRWRLTSAGERLLHSGLRANEQKLLDDLDPDKLLEVMRHVGGAMVNAHGPAATMAAREWRYNLAERKRTGRH